MLSNARFWKKSGRRSGRRRWRLLTQSRISRLDNQKWRVRCGHFRLQFFDLNQIQGSGGHARLFLDAWMRQHDVPSSDAIDKGEFKMKVTEKLFLASILALSMVGPVQAQSPTQGDYYAPGPTVVVHPTQGQVLRAEQ